MRLLAVFLVATIFVFGCARPDFTNLGNGVGVPPEGIDEYAKAHSISRAEARDRMLEEFNEHVHDLTRNSQAAGNDDMHRRMAFGIY